MSRGGGASPRSDEELLASLYEDARGAGGEHDTLDAASGEARTPGGQDDDEELDRELAQLRQLRGVFAELRANQEEPPPAGMALLLAAARQAAEERKAAEEQKKPAGLWARLRAGWQAMVAHPAMAAAAAAVVVIGASGYLVSRGVARKAEPTYSSGQVDELARRVEELEKDRAAPAASSELELRGQAPAQIAEPMPVPPAIPADPEGGASAGMGSAAPTAAEPAAADSEEKVQVQRRKAGTAATKPAGTDDVTGSAGRGEAAAGGAATGASGAEPSGPPVRDALDASYAKRNNDGAAAPSAPVEAPRPAATPAPAPPPPPPPAPAGAPKPAPKPVTKKPVDGDRGAADAPASADAADADSSAVEDEAPKPSKPSRVESLSQQADRWLQLARAAAKKGNCSEVRLLAERVRSEDQELYEKKFAKDPLLKKCLP